MWPQQGVKMQNLIYNYIQRYSKSMFILFSLTSLTGCAQMIPGLMDAIDDAVTDEAVCIRIDKSALTNETDISVQLEIINRDPIPTASMPSKKRT